jgi:hypothetical protein
MSDAPDPIDAATEDGAENSTDDPGWLTRNRGTILRGLATVAVGVLVIGTITLSWLLAGPVATIVYVTLYLISATLLPGLVMVLRDLMPSLVAKLLFTLGQLAYGEGWLVQVDREWRMCPGRTVGGDSEVYVDDEWYDVPDTTNQTVLGWQPFGILLFKDDGTLAEYRDDSQTESIYDDIVDVQPDPITDGGSGADVDHWELDFRRYWQSVCAGIGDIELVEDVERVTQRDEAVADAGSSKRYMIGSAFGVIAGAATGYVAMAGV